MAQIPQLQSTNTLGSADETILRQGTKDKRISLELANTLSWAKRNGYTYLGEHTIGVQFSDTESFTIYQGQAYFTKRGVALPYTTSSNNPVLDDNLEINRQYTSRKVYVEDFGAVGDGIVDDTSAIQAALDYSKLVSFENENSRYRVTDTLRLSGGHTLLGDSKAGGTTPLQGKIFGDMAVNKPLFSLGDGSDTSLRYVTFSGMNLYNNNGSCIDINYSTENTFEYCTMRSRYANCVNSIQNYSNNFYGCTLSSSGYLGNDGTTPTYALSLLDNTNGMLISGSRISGGSVGGVADIGQSYNIKFCTCIFEVSYFGIRAGRRLSAEGGGLVTNLTVSNCNWEQSYLPLDIGGVYPVLGFNLEGSYIANSSTTHIAARDSSVILGRVEAANITGNTFEPHSTETLFNFTYSISGAPYRNLNNSRISNNTFKSVGSGNYFKLTDFTNVVNKAYLSNNTLVLDEEFGERHIFNSELITCSSGIDPTVIAPLSTLGGILDRVEIIAVDGTLDGTLRIGNATLAGEIMEVDLSTVTVNLRYADISSEITLKEMRVDSSPRISVSGGSTSGTFMVRLTYRS